MTEQKTIMITGVIGLLAATLVGIGEFLLHFDPLARYGDGFAFFDAVSQDRATLGHFIGLLSAPLYIVGAYHLYLMLRPANEIAARVAGFAMAYGCAVGAVWIGSRSMAVELVANGSIAEQLDLYTLRYESLLTVLRAVILIVSGIMVWLCLTGRSLYPRKMALLNPIFLIIAAFIIFLTIPTLGKYIMPIALNVAYFTIFAASLTIASKLPKEG